MSHILYVFEYVTHIKYKILNKQTKITGKKQERKTKEPGETGSGWITDKDGNGIFK